LNQPGDLGFTPLHNAAMAGRAEVAKQLVKLGANPQVLNDFGQTAAEVATLGGHEDLAIFLRDLASSR
jgi:ankyrin repeat protein